MTGVASEHSKHGEHTFRHELLDFWQFVRHPSPVSRLAANRPGSGLVADWWPGVRPGRILAWAAMLWCINMFALGPLAVAAAGASGVTHRLDMNNIPWLTAVLWAPLVEEMLFRYGLRRPAQALWLCPALLPALFWGPRWWTLALVALVLIVAAWSLRPGVSSRVHWDAHWRRYYLKHFGLVFHLVALTFAAVHLSNFSYSHTVFWLLPLLVLPQWVTGLVLGWMRVRRGIGASIALHATFNAGPMLLIWLILTWLPSLAQ